MEQNPTIQWYPGHMVRAKREMVEDLQLVDLLLEVLDARAPESSRNPDLQEYRAKKGAKAHILLLNKADLADSALTQRWLREFRRQGFAPLPFQATAKKGNQQLLALVEQVSQPLWDKLARRGRLPRPVRAMVIGVPNSGKSTVINALAPAAKAKTGNKPGVTRGRQWVKTQVGVELLDTPGVLWPRFADYQTAFRLAVVGSISDQVYPVYQVAGELALWLWQRAPEALQTRYRLDPALPAEAEALFAAIAQSRGMLGPGGKPRDEDAAYHFLQEFRAGKLGRFTLEAPEEKCAHEQNGTDSPGQTPIA